MTTFPLPPAVLTSGAVLLLALTACGGTQAGPDKERPDGDASDPDEARPLGAIDTFFQEMYGDVDQDTANAQQVQVEELIAACMRDQGFDYIPVDYSGQESGDPAEELDVEWGTLEFAEQYGYGATTNPWGDASQGGPGEEWVDPNQAAVDAMSDGERDAYDAALWGAPPEPAPSDDPDAVIETEYDWTTAGCSGAAQHEVYDTQEGVDEDEFASLQEEMGQMWEATSADARVTGLEAEWASCMADAGYPGFTAVDDAENSIYEKTSVIWEDVYAQAGYDETSVLTEEDYQAIDDAVKEKTAALTEEEIATAVADFTCRDSVRYTEVQQEVSFEYQQEFYDTHQDELEAWAAATKAQGGAG